MFESKEQPVKKIENAEEIVKEEKVVAEEASEKYKAKFNRPSHFDIISEYLDRFDDDIRSILELFIGNTRREVLLPGKKHLTWGKLLKIFGKRMRRREPGGMSVENN